MGGPTTAVAAAGALLPPPPARAASAGADAAGEPERRLRAIADVVAALVRECAVGGRDVDLAALKAAAASRHRLRRAPKLVEILAALPDAHRARLAPRLRAKPVRTASGVAVVAVMSKPHRCPHLATTGAVCVYCPGGPDSDFEYSTQSYTGYEPTSMRAIRARYDAYAQARARVEQLRRLGHSADKVEFVLMGGTFMSLPADYRDAFVRALHDALSGRGGSGSAAEAVAHGEHARARCVGLTIETRPDHCLAPHLRDMLSYGCTRLEMGVQSVYEDVARDTNRGHTVAAVRACFALAKDAGFKVVAHMMPDLPRVGWERDVEAVREFFEAPAYRADGLKLYPTLVIRGTGLYELWRKGLYRNYHPDRLVDLVARCVFEFFCGFFFLFLWLLRVQGGRVFVAAPEATTNAMCVCLSTSISLPFSSSLPRPPLSIATPPNQPTNRPTPQKQHARPRPPLGPRLPRPARHPHAARQQRRRARQPARARAGAHGPARPAVPRRAHARGGHPGPAPRGQAEGRRARAAGLRGQRRVGDLSGVRGRVAGHLGRPAAAAAAGVGVGVGVAYDWKRRGRNQI